MHDILKTGLAELGLPFSEQAAAKLVAYYEYLTEKNAVMNLTAITGREETARLHFLDCAALLKAADFRGKRVVDVGTGAGFPGLVLKILEPSVELCLLDAQQKRVDFLSETARALGLSGVRCVHGRAEEFFAAAGGERESYDFAVSRAVARLNMLAELCLPAVRVGGAFLAMKGPEAQSEKAEAKSAAAILGGLFAADFEYSIPGTDTRHCAVIIEKTAPTPAKYPRRFAKIQKQPL